MKLGGVVIAGALVLALAACGGDDKDSSTAKVVATPTATAATPLPTPTPQPRAVDQQALETAMVTAPDVGPLFTLSKEEKLGDGYANLQRSFKHDAAGELYVAWILRDNGKPLDEYANVTLDAFRNQGLTSRRTLPSPGLGRESVRYAASGQLDGHAATLDVIVWRDYGVIGYFYLASAGTANALPVAEKQQVRLTEVFRPGVTVTRLATAQPQRTATPQPSPTPNQAAIAAALYSTRMVDITGRYEKVFSTLSGLFETPQPANSLWRARYTVAMADLRAANEDAKKLEPPACYAEVHKWTSAAATFFNLAATQFDLVVLASDMSALSGGISAIDTGRTALTEAARAADAARC